MAVCSGRWLANTGSKEEELVSEGTLDRIGTLEDVARVVVRPHPCSSASALLCDQPSLCPVLGTSMFGLDLTDTSLWL